MTTDAELFDYLRTHFGIGDCDEGQDEPYWKWRATEIGKLKRFMRSRRTNAAELQLAATYAVDSRIPITATWQLIPLVAAAHKRNHVSTRARAAERLQQAAMEAYNAGHHDLASQLHMADPSAAEELLAEWEAMK